MANDDTQSKNEDLRPVPDPTFLTTQQLYREVQAVKEVYDTRLDGMDKAITLFNENMTRVPTDTDKQISHLKELHGEKFASIAIQFKERDTRTEQTARDSKVAVDAALQAAKEAVGEQNKSSALAISKSEAATVKQIDQIQTLIISSNKGTDDKIGDLKERLTRIEGGAVGRVAEQLMQDTSSRTHQGANSNIVAIFSAILSFIAVMVVIIKAVTGH